MAGLLGDSWEDPRTQATLQLAAGLLGGGNFGQALGRGLEGYQGTMTAAKRQAMIDEEMTRRKQEREAEQAQLAAKQAEALRIENVVRGSLMPVSGSRAIGQDAGGPTQAKAALIGQAPKLDANALLAQGVPYERVKALFEAQNLGRDEVARTAEVEGPNGQKIIQGFNKWGGRAGEGVSGYVAPQLVNQGDRQTFVKPSAGVSLGVGMSPAERDAAARGWATNALAQQRLALDQQQNTHSFNADLGGWVPKSPGGQFVPMEGAPKNQKLTESEAKSTLYLSQMREASKVLDSANVSPATIAMTGNPYTNWAAGEKSQVAGQAQRQWAEAYLRAKTGAAATAGEVENNIRTFFPVLGDSDAAIKRKAEARMAAEQGMEIPSGRGAQQVEKRQAPEALPNLPPAAQHKGRTIRDTQTGKMLRSDGMTWKEQ